MYNKITNLNKGKIKIPTITIDPTKHNNVYNRTEIDTIDSDIHQDLINIALQKEITEDDIKNFTAILLSAPDTKPNDFEYKNVNAYLLCKKNNKKVTEIKLLDVVVENGHTELVKVLCSYGAEIDYDTRFHHAPKNVDIENIFTS